MQFATPRPNPHIELGDLIAVAYDEARSVTDNEADAMRLATHAVSELLASTDNERAIRDLAGLDS